MYKIHLVFSNNELTLFKTKGASYPRLLFHFSNVNSNFPKLLFLKRYEVYDYNDIYLSTSYLSLSFADDIFEIIDLLKMSHRDIEIKYSINEDSSEFVSFKEKDFIEYLKKEWK